MNQFRGIGISIICGLWATPMAFAQTPSDVVIPPPRTITTHVKPERARRVVELQYNDEEMRICLDSWTLEASRVEIYPGQNVEFHVRSSRKCEDHSLKAPTVQSATINIRAAKGKKSSSDMTQTLEPDSSSYGFSHIFQTSGSYLVTVQNRVNDLETHTVSVGVVVMEPGTNAVQPKNAE